VNRDQLLNGENEGTNNPKKQTITTNPQHFENLTTIQVSVEKKMQSQ
jgi:hypothetical protein